MKQNSKFIMYRQVILCLLLILFISVSPASAQEQGQYFISPGLQLGLHTKAGLESPIKELITIGTAVEVIKTEQEFSHIKTPEGIEGWIKTQFLTQDEPAVLKVNKLEKALQESLTDNASEASTTDTASDKLLSCKETIATLQDELTAWEQLDSQDRQAQKLQAEKNNQQLKERLSMIASLATGKEVSSSQFDAATLVELPKIIDSSDHNILKLFKKNYLILAMVAGLSFLLGIFVMDAINRRRHGGYRV